MKPYVAILLSALVVTACADASQPGNVDSTLWTENHPPSQPPRQSADASPLAGPLVSATRAPLSDSVRAMLDTAVLRASELAGGDVSVAAVHVESGVRYAFGGARRSFLATTVRLPLAVQLLARVDRGEIRLEDSVRLERSDVRPSSLNPMAMNIPGGIGGGSFAVGAYARSFRSMTVKELLRRAMTQIDATAIDALMRVSGGPAKVQAELRARGITGIRVDRTYADYIWDYIGAARRPQAADWSVHAFDSVARSIPSDQRDDAAYRFYNDVRDRASADAMTSLLQRIAQGELLSDSSRAMLVTLGYTGGMSGEKSLGVPNSYLQVAGSWGGWKNLRAWNEVTLVKLPKGGGRLALAVMTSNTTTDSVSVAVKTVGRRVYDAFAKE